MEDVFTLDSSFLAGEREKIRKSIAYARYKVGNTWYQAKIEKTAILSDGRVEVVFLIDHTVSGNITITEVELCDYNGQRVGNKTVSISRKDATEGILYVCRFEIMQIQKLDDGNYKKI